MNLRHPLCSLRAARPFALVVVLLLAPALAHASTGGIGDLFVTSDASNMVRAYAGITGSYLGVFTGSALGSGELGIHFGATNNRVLVGHFGGGVDEFDATTGAYIKTYSPGGGWQWAGIYAPNGNVYIGSMTTNDIREYDANTGAFVRVLCTIPGPADMAYGPNGHLYICSYQIGGVKEVDAVTGATYSSWMMPIPSSCNDIAFLPNGYSIVTAMGPNVAFVFDTSNNFAGQFQGTGWQRPHGVVISPHNGRILVADGVTTQVHEFDPVTFTELNANFLSPNPGDKIVDIDFRPDRPTPAGGTTFGRLKSLYR
jgi:DNA-binding beta-propeller fold protein YncE